MAGGFGVQLTAEGSTKNLERFLKMAGQTNEILARINGVAQQGVNALAAATPKRSGRTAAMWSYRIIVVGDGLSIEFHNSNVNQGRNIAVLIRYGHGTRNGGYVPPNDFITPALRPIFEQIADNAWKAVTSV
jgi:hypothetical protein